MLVVLCHSTAYSQDSTKFIDDIKVVGQDTLLCFDREKVLDFARTKIDLKKYTELYENAMLKDTLQQEKISFLGRVIVKKDGVIMDQREIIQNQKTIISNSEENARRQRFWKKFSISAGSIVSGFLATLLIFK